MSMNLENGSPYNITVKVSQHNVTTSVIQKKITDFQTVFANVASRYYTEQVKGERE